MPGYVVAQLLGGLVGGGIVYGTYIHATDIVEGSRGIRTLKTARFFGFIPVSIHFGDGFPSEINTLARLPLERFLLFLGIHLHISPCWCPCPKG